MENRDRARAIVPPSTNARQQGDPAPADRVAEALFGKTRRRVLDLLLRSPFESRYLSQIVAAVGTGLGAVRRELECLVEAGLLVRERDGGRVYYRANAACPVLPELRAFVEKTSGVAVAIRRALEPLADRVEVAFLFGSMARGAARADSDIDLFVVGRASFREVVGAISALQNEVGREINPVVMTSEEFQHRLGEPDRFFQNVLEGRKEFVLGGESDLGQMA